MFDDIQFDTQQYRHSLVPSMPEIVRLLLRGGKQWGEGVAGMLFQLYNIYREEKRWFSPLKLSPDNCNTVIHMDSQWMKWSVHAFADNILSLSIIFIPSEYLQFQCSDSPI